MPKRKSKNKGFIWLILIGLIGSGAAYFAFVSNMADVVVATQTISANQQITSDMIKTKKVDKSALPSKYLTASSADSLVGLYTNVGITEGSIFTSANVATKDTKKSAVIPAGYTLLSVNITQLPQGVAPGDRVNLLIGLSTASEGRVVITYQNIQVTNTYKNDNGQVSGLEVQVTPEQAQQIQYAALNGELSVSLLPPGYTEESLPTMNEAQLKNYANGAVQTGTEDDTKQEEQETDTNTETNPFESMGKNDDENITIGD